MSRRLAAVPLLILLFLVTPVLSAAPKQKCPLSAQECEKQIREMLSGKRYLGVKLEETRHGLVITRVVPDSPAEFYGLHEGDRILSVNGIDCTGAKINAFKQVLSRIGEERKMIFTIDRAGFFESIAVQMEVMSEKQIDQIVATHLREAHQVTQSGAH
jgi:predicted metalloprotease with PDZ domain